MKRKVCNKCSIYYPSLKALNAHLIVCATDDSTLEEDLKFDQGDSDTIDQDPNNVAVPEVFEPRNVFQHLDRIFEENA